jgi:dihydrofolate reductase
MAKLIYIAITSLDGYVEDEGGTFDWAVPDEEVHTFVNDLLRPVGTYLYGRRMYETMVAWETMDTAAHAIKAGLVDEYQLIISPILVGGGKQSLPNHVLLRLDLLAERRFGNGVVHLHYRSRWVS